MFVNGLGLLRDVNLPGQSLVRGGGGLDIFSLSLASEGSEGVDGVHSGSIAHDLVFVHDVDSCWRGDGKREWLAGRLFASTEVNVFGQKATATVARGSRDTERRPTLELED